MNARTRFLKGKVMQAKSYDHGQCRSNTRTLINGFLKHDIPSQMNTSDTVALKSNIHTKIGRESFSVLI
jgi:hypothetical protein